MEERNGVVVTKESFIHADSTRAYLQELANTGNKVNVIRPNRELADTDNQDVIRMNEDTLYARIILDVKGGATISVKDYEGFQNIHVLDINHSQIISLSGVQTVELDESMLTEGQHVYVLVRTGLLRNLPADEMMKKAHEAQDNIAITFNSSEPWVPSVDYDLSTIDAVKYQIFAEYTKNPIPSVSRKGFGTTESRDNEAALVVVGMGWGGLEGHQAVYSPFTGTGERRQFTIDKPNLDFNDSGFFSITVYTEFGWIATRNYAINSDNLEANEDGTYTVTFLASGEPAKDGEKNILRTPRGNTWAGVLRAYSPMDKDEVYDWADNWTDKMTEEFHK